jgi:hypothetical protein
MAGYYSTRLNEGTLDPLYATALVIEKDGTKAALVSLDLIGTTFGVVTEARKLVEQATGIPGSNVMISATHSHTGPILADDKPRDDAFGGGSDLAKSFIKGLPTKIAEAVHKADSTRVPAKFFRGVGREDGLAFNRRFHMADGTVGWNPGKANPNIVRPAGPTDPAVPVVHVETADGKSLATYVNFAMHLDTVGGLSYSADYPYPLGKALAAVKGEQHLTLFTIGTAGDINHIDVSHKRPQKGPAEASRIGTRLAAEVLRTYEKLEPVTDGLLKVSREVIDLPLTPVTPAEVEVAKEVVAKLKSGAKPAPKFLDQVAAFKATDITNRNGKPLAVEVQVIALGPDLAWVSLPGEIFVELGLAIKAGSPFKQTIIAELANGSIGYIPTKKAYEQGNYEVVSARCAAGSGEKLADEALRQLRAAYELLYRGRGR